MDRFDLLSIRCKMCDWQWEIPNHEETKDLICSQCGSKKLELNKHNLHMLKKGGKFITDIGFSTQRDKFGSIIPEQSENQNDEPLLVVKGSNVAISEDMTNEELKNLLRQMNSIKSKILDEIALDHEELAKKFLK